MTKLTYPNHYKMKKNRLLKFQLTQNKCELCGEMAKKIHHRDGGKTDHSIENLLAVCNKCHGLLHRQPRFIQRYGFALKEICKKLDCNAAKIERLHKKGLLEEFIKKGQPLKKKITLQYAAKKIGCSITTAFKLQRNGALETCLLNGWQRRRIKCASCCFHFNKKCSRFRGKKQIPCPICGKTHC